MVLVNLIRIWVLDNCLGHPKLSPHLGHTHYGIPVAWILLARHCLFEGTTDR